MALVRWDPAREMTALQGEMNRLFSSFFDTPTMRRGAAASASRRWIPAIDLVDVGGQVVLTADLPGMSESDVRVEIDRNVLTIAGERTTSVADEHAGYYRLERASGAFSRSLALPEGVDPGAITASFKDGVLEVRIPKPVQAEPRRVQIAVDGAEPRTIEAEAGDPAVEQAGSDEH